MGEGTKSDLPPEPGQPEPVLDFTSEKKFSIRCEICQGWHATELHENYTKEGREKIRKIIEERPDSAYNFNTLGVEATESDAEKSWQHIVVEKAKELGDDLQNSNFLIHNGPIDVQIFPASEKIQAKYPGLGLGEESRYESLLSIFTQKSLNEGHRISSGERRHDTWFFSAHRAGGNDVYNYSEGDALAKILEQQEIFMRDRTAENLKRYQELITGRLTQEIEKLKFNIKHNDTQYLGGDLLHAKELLKTLDSMDGRKKAVKFIMTKTGFTKGFGPKFGVIAKISNKMKADENIKYVSDGGGPYREPIYDVKDRNGFPIADGIADLDRAELEQKEMDSEQGLFYGNYKGEPNVEDARKFFADFIHGVHIRDGSIEEQREFLERMLELTKDHPERRVPLYNYYGKLIWPRPPK